MDFTRVDRTQPKAPQGDLEQRAKALDAVDARLGVQAHGKTAPRAILAALTTVMVVVGGRGARGIA
jgi:hypothetical protein